MNMTFLLVSAALFLVALALLLRPLLRRSTQAARGASRQELNAAIYRDQLAELESDRSTGSLAESDFAQASAELQRRLLQDAAPQLDDTLPTSARPAWRTALCIGLALPLAAALLYSWLGKPAALQQEQAAAHPVTSEQIEQMVAALAARLEKNPGDLQGWAMLGRSYKAMRRFDDAERAFGHLGDVLNNDPVLLAEYADLLAVRANGSLEGKPLELVRKALKLDPNNTMSLALAGTAAYDRHDYPEAVRYWEHLQQLLPAESEDAKALTATLAEIRGKGGASVTPAAAPTGKPAAAVAPGKTVSGRVTLAPALAAKVQAGDTVFVFARAIDGPRIPLAVLRVRGQDLPLAFSLDDSLAINPELKISGASQVKIEARVSKSGNATPQSGDLIGESGAVKPGATGVNILIEKSIP